MLIAEIFRSRQGEGFLTGTESVFVRTSGCNLRCDFCDTPYTSWAPEGKTLDLDQIVAQVERLSARHVVLTGGEPMLFPEIVDLCRRFRAARLHVTIETAGTIDQAVACDLMSISPKLENSTPSVERAGPWRERHERTRDNPAVIERWLRDYEYQLKFVVGSPDDCRAVQTWLERYPTARRERVQLMPLGTDEAELRRIGEWLEPYCRTHDFYFCPRRHIEWYGAVRGT